MVKKGKAFSKIKVYLAIGRRETPFGVSIHERGPQQASSVWVTGAIVGFVARAALSCHPFELIEVVELKLLSIKKALLISLTTAKRVSDLQALSVHPSCLQMAQRPTTACLRPNPAFVPKLRESSSRCPTLELLAFHPPPFLSEEDKRLCTLCPVWTLECVCLEDSWIQEN